MQKRKKPMLLSSRVRSICEIAVGVMHVLWHSAGRAVHSWGCKDGGVLGSASDSLASHAEPHPVTMPSGVAVRHVSCGDCHSCALDEKRRVWLRGTYKDSNGYIGIAHKRKQETEVLEKSAEPTLVLEGCVQVASGANHTVALAAPSGHNQVFAWGSNATGQLGLQGACGFSERTLPCSGSVAGLSPREGGGCEVAGEQVVRIHQADGSVRAATSMTAEQVQQAVVQGASALVLQVAEREVPKPEKQKLLQPQQVPLEVGAGEHVASALHASAECSFVTFEDGAVFGCGLNGDGQVGLGFVSMAVQQLQAVPAVRRASWIGGGLHSTAALVDGRVFTWGKAEECGIGLGEK
ncbi:Rcc1, partial [Symbiodinium sp. CCMP2456]